MITAEQARERNNLSKKNIQRYLDLFETAIGIAADANETQLYASSIIQLAGDPVLNDHIQKFDKAPHSPLRVAVIAELKKFGFNASMEPHGKSYIPASKDLEDNAEQYRQQHYTLLVRW